MSLRINKTEAWALNIVSRVEKGEKVEDTRVELKREWPDSQKAARRIAAHANSCFGSDILWIIGLDETKGVAGIEAEELANWWPNVCSYFNGITPALTDFILPIQDKSLVCLLFETSRPPYVVKNPAYGLQYGGPVNWEVPWREGTSTRTATRNDLVRMLIPTLSQPEIEVLGGSGNMYSANNESIYVKSQRRSIRFSISIYLYPRNDSLVVIPFHKCQCVLSDGIGNIFDEFEFSMSAPHGFVGGGNDSATIENTSSELLAHGPGKCSIYVNSELEEVPSWFDRSELTLRFLIYVIGSELPVDISVTLKQDIPTGNTTHQWSIRDWH